MAYSYGSTLYGDPHSYGSPPPLPPPPLPLLERKVVEEVNPCSGRYDGAENGLDVELMVDVDKTRKYAASLNVISGTITAKSAREAPWSVDASSMHFKTLPETSLVTRAGPKKRGLGGAIRVFFSDGTRSGGRIAVQLSLNNGTWKAEINVTMKGHGDISFKSIPRKSLFFKDIKLDIDYVDKLTWPTVELKNVSQPPAGMEDRKLDPFSAFEDAGLKLLFDAAHSEKVEDPTPHNAWTKSDLYEAMMSYFDVVDGSDDDIWCMLGTAPPDKRYMGFSFDKNGRRGFGLFTEHCSFKGLESDDPMRKAEAQRRLLHYLVHECGHCLGLKHPFEIGAPDSLSWMNYAWKYDTNRDAGSFYQKFRYTFSDQELMILRHSPGKGFRAVAQSAVMSVVMGSGYSVKSEVPDITLADDDDDQDVEAGYSQPGGYGQSGGYIKPTGYGQPGGYGPEKTRPMRKIGLDLKMQDQTYVKGQLLSFEARIKNKGKLPALIEGDLSLESGNLQVYLTGPDGSSQVLEPFARAVQSGYSRPRVLYTPEDEEGSDRYSELVTVGMGANGYQITTPGQYQVRAVYSGGRYKATSQTYSINVVDGEEDDETADEVLTAATLQSSSYGRFKKAKKFWENLEKEPVEKKKGRVATLVGVFEGMANDARYAAPVGKKTRSGRRKVAYSTTSQPEFTRDKLLKDTGDVVNYYQQQGSKDDNMGYSNLVFARGKLYMAEKNTEAADKEFNQMMTDLVGRGAKYSVVTSLKKKWDKMKNPTNREEKFTAENLQKKVNAVLTWAPTTYGNGEPDRSGIGLGRPFSNFDAEQIQKASKVIDMLFTKYEETQDLLATISFADKLQKGREVNYMVLRWALEAFIVHNKDAKAAGIRYPEPEDMDSTYKTDAAMIVTKREGEPAEDWMNYWRCDADFNYHHRHWHVVYVVRHYLHQLGAKVPKHLERQGELFGYMHSQLLARYDAERESWGLPPVVAWSYNETAMEFSAGMEFHDDQQYRDYTSRPATVWPSDKISLFQKWEAAYEAALKVGEVKDGIKLDPNWAGHILEPSSSLFSHRYGHLHNAGHGIFGSTGLPPRATSYMNDTATAVRDLIFYRWHKKIDDLWHKNNDRFSTEIGEDGPPVVITANDVHISTEKEPPANFDKFSYGNWQSNPPPDVACLKTFLGPATKKYEWDNKLSHERFFYHLRMKRATGSKPSSDMNLTIRIFICPKNRQSDRRKWIEMDKFICKIPAGDDHISLTRFDLHSSVIKRRPQDLEGSSEGQFVRDVHGFCECGWPYAMMLPRGKKEGQEFVLFVMATDNEKDQIGIRTRCGSMSYCGAQGEVYPDRRNMGYPFCSPITYKGDDIPIPEVFDNITNAAYKTFKIENNVAEPPPMKAVDIWWPHKQLAANDGTMKRRRRVTEFMPSNLRGGFRVLIDNDAADGEGGGKVMVRFQGRGAGAGSYSIRDISLALRKANTLDVVKEEIAKVTYKGQVSFAVPETGLVSDVVDLNFDLSRGDYFLTFVLDSGGVMLPASQNMQISTYSMPYYFRPGQVPENWSQIKRFIRGRFPHIICVAGIMKEIE